MNTEFEFDVALSFAGENRAYVDEVAKMLDTNGIRHFYDSDREAYLWGKDLIEELDETYKNKSKYCVMFISEHYANKRWTNHERKSAQERAFNDNKEYILPARFDDTTIPSIRGTVGYIDLRNLSPENFAQIITNPNYA
ncbi:MAG: hypothetical protein COV35_08170 [Alphaproteobacteria bacterium CG11_big_fil_rev_8_21_14_0_20_39_49]|nr:MAG: hypothetical protein COV35_08170 [Alphaproteobacteria bacterium CG11_big_fil_rev_8_21_14_0_20_39_49]